MVRLQISADMRGPLAALARMRTELEKAAQDAVVSVATTAQEEAKMRAPRYRGVPRTSVDSRTGKHYVDRDLLHKQIRMRTAKMKAAVGILPADGEDDHMVPYWRAQEYGLTGGQHIVGVRRPHRLLIFPAAAWKSAEVKTSPEHPGGRQPYHGVYSLRWVTRGPIAPTYFMRRGFGAAWPRAGEAMRDATKRIMQRWGRK